RRPRAPRLRGRRRDRGRRPRRLPRPRPSRAPQRRRRPAHLPRPRLRVTAADDRKDTEMSRELTAKTERGGRRVAAAEELSATVAERAADHDRDATFPFEGLAALKQSGYLVAPIPASLGGLGVTSLHDVLVASSRLARGDAALTIGVNMHLVFLFNVV